MKRTTSHHDDMRGELSRREGPAFRHRLSSRAVRTMTPTAALASLVILAAGCGGPKSPGGANAGGGSSSGTLARFEAYSKCMRSHGIHDFPDPTTSPDGGVSIQINGGPGSDLDRNNPTYKSAELSCQSLEPGSGSQPAVQSPQKIAAEVKWARCMRSHGVPSFPDPDRQGAFDSSKFNESTPAFRAASNACQSLMNDLGAIPVHPGHG